MTQVNAMAHENWNVCNYCMCAIGPNNYAKQLAIGIMSYLLLDVCI